MNSKIQFPPIPAAMHLRRAFYLPVHQFQTAEVIFSIATGDDFLSPVVHLQSRAI